MCFAFLPIKNSPHSLPPPKKKHLNVYPCSLLFQAPEPDLSNYYLKTSFCLKSILYRETNMWSLPSCGPTLSESHLISRCYCGMDNENVCCWRTSLHFQKSTREIQCNNETQMVDNNPQSTTALALRNCHVVHDCGGTFLFGRPVTFDEIYPKIVVCTD